MAFSGTVKFNDGYSRVTATLEAEDIKEIASTGQTKVINGITMTSVCATTDDSTETGYVDTTEWTYNVVEIPASFAGLESVMVPTKLRDQLFDIVEVVEGDDYVDITALHMFYRLRSNITMWEPEEYTYYSAASACRQILDYAMTNMDFLVASDCKDILGGYTLDFTRKNIAEAFLDPESGLCAKYGLSLIRDNDRFYCLKDVGYFRGFIVEDGKNLIGVERTENIEDIITRVAPVGKDEDGEYVYYRGADGHDYVDSTHINEYVVPRMESYITDLEIGKDGTTESNIHEKLHDYAMERFTDDEVDIPSVTMTINFLSLGDTIEYQQYKNLDKVYLYDIIQIIDKTRGYNYAAQVISVEHNILTGVLESVTIGTPQKWSGSRKIGTWQVPEISGGKIRAKTIRAGTLADESVTNSSIGGGAVSSNNLDSTVDGKFTNLFAEQLYISNTSEDGLLHTEFSVKEGEIQSLVRKTGVDGLGPNDTLFSKITQTASDITAEVTRATAAEGTLTGKITVEAGKITQIVQAVGDDGEVTAASIVLAINESTGQSEAKIDADHVYIGNTKSTTIINGKLEASDITANLIDSKISEISMMHGVSGYFSGSLRVASGLYLGADATDVSKNLMKAVIGVDVTGNTLTLTQANGDETTFSKATSLSGAWSGTTYTVTASPQGNTNSSSVYLAIEGSANPNATVYAKIYKDNPSVAGNQLTSTTMTLAEDVSNKKVTLSANSLTKGSISTQSTYNSGRNSVTVSSIEVYGSPAATATSITVKATASNGASNTGSINITSQRNNAYSQGITYAKDGLYVMGPNGNASTEDKRTSVSINPANSIDLWPAFYNGSQYVWGTKCTVSANGTKFNGPGGSTYTTLYYLYNGNYLSAGNHSWYYV